MFGVFRLVLAVMVLITHIGGVEIVAGLAVWGFFMLSGFLMTAVLNKKYGFDGKGLAVFSLSRGIRLFPSYWISVLLTLAIILTFSSTLSPTLINQALEVPVTTREVFSNFFIVGHTLFGIGRIENALSPSAWAVDVEILMYACSCIFLAKRPRVAMSVAIGLFLLFPLLWVLAKLAIAQEQVALAGQLTYSFLPSALLPYSIGSVLWFKREELPRIAYTKSAVVTGICGIGFCISFFSQFSVTATYVLSLPFLAFILLFLSKQKWSTTMRRVDIISGHMAYPVYLLHWICGYVILLFAPADHTWFIFSNEKVQFTVSGFFIVLIFTLAVSFIFALLIEGPLERVRHTTALKLSSILRQRLS